MRWDSAANRLSTLDRVFCDAIPYPAAEVCGAEGVALVVSYGGEVARGLAPLGTVVLQGRNLNQSRTGFQPSR
ncbi:MAG TPA: hypothetical protein VGV59_19830 [Pyrinomonadaceae bacterium]|nr:hypothetical protein [Pyrinomonadaceae bacterium]